MRPSDFLSIHRKDVHLDDDPAYLQVFRVKTSYEGPVVLDSFPTTQTVLRKWMSFLPAGAEQLWYQLNNHGSVIWDAPYLHPDLDGASISSRIRRAAKVAGISGCSARCGRVSAITACFRAGVPEWVSAMQTGHVNGGVHIGYFADRGIQDLRGVFSQVPEFVQFERGLMDVIQPYLAGIPPEQIPAELPKLCVVCGKSLKMRRGDSKTCSDACRQKRLRQMRHISTVG
jgi:hypothetical protein